MPRQSISLTPPNDEWLKAQVDSEEYSSKSEIESIRARLIVAEQNGFTTQSRAEILTEIKNEARRDGEL